MSSSASSAVASLVSSGTVGVAPPDSRRDSWGWVMPALGKFALGEPEFGATVVDHLAEQERRPCLLVGGVVLLGAGALPARVTCRHSPSAFPLCFIAIFARRSRSPVRDRHVPVRTSAERRLLA